MVNTRKRVVFWFLLLLLENMLLLVVFIGGIWLLAALTPQGKSAFEQDRGNPIVANRMLTVMKKEGMYQQ